MHKAATGRAEAKKDTLSSKAIGQYFSLLLVFKRANLDPIFKKKRILSRWNFRTKLLPYWYELRTTVRQ